MLWFFRCYWCRQEHAWHKQQINRPRLTMWKSLMAPISYCFFVFLSNIPFLGLQCLHCCLLRPGRYFSSLLRNSILAFLCLPDYSQHPFLLTTSSSIVGKKVSCAGNSVREFMVFGSFEPHNLWGSNRVWLGDDERHALSDSKIKEKDGGREQRCCWWSRINGWRLPLAGVRCLLNLYHPFHRISAHVKSSWTP